MLAQFPQSTKARFKALQFRAVPVTVSPARQSHAAALAPAVKSIKPGVYVIGPHFIDLWRNICTCRQERVKKLKPCTHRLALWLAEGVELNDPDPALYLKTAGVEQPAIITWYADLKNTAGEVNKYRIEFTDTPGLLAAIGLNHEDHRFCTYEDLYYLTPFYE